MPKEPENEKRTSLDDRRNNIRERIAFEVSRIQSDKKQPEDNKVKPVAKKGPGGYRAILQAEREFEKSLENLPKEQVRQKRFERIEQVKQWYKEAEISENYLIERARQLYHNLPGDIPQFFKYQDISQRTFDRTLAKTTSSEERKAEYLKYKSSRTNEINTFTEQRKEYLATRTETSPKYLNPEKVLRDARYIEFATTRGKEIFDENERTLKEALEKLKKDFPDRYEEEVKRLQKEEEERKDAILKPKRDEFEAKIQNVRDYIDSQKEIERDALNEKVNALNEKIYSSDVNADFSKEKAELDEEFRAINAKYKEQLEFLENHSEDLWIGNYKAFKGDRKALLDAFSPPKEEDKEVGEKPIEKQAQQKENQSEVNKGKVVVDLKEDMRTNLLKTCNATLGYFDTRLQYGLDYALTHHARMDRSILEPSFNELSEFTVISHDISAEFKRQSEENRRELEAHSKAKPWIFAKWFNTKRWQKWEKRGEKLEANKKDLAIVSQKIMDQRQMIGKYIAGLRSAGVSQEMINKCSAYEKAVLNTKITEQEIKDEAKRCKQQFDKTVTSLQQAGKTKELTEIFKERMKCVSGPESLQNIRKGIYSREELEELYPQGQNEKMAPMRADKRTELVDDGKINFTEAFYSDLVFDFEKDADLTLDDDKDLNQIPENKTKNIVNMEDKEHLDVNVNKAEESVFFDKRIGKDFFKDIFEDEIDLANELGVFDEPKEFENSADLQNSLSENTKKPTEISEAVKENKDLQLKKDSIQNS